MAKKESKNNQFLLTKEEINKLSKIAESFKDVDQFTITQTNESGIGPTVRVHFTLFDKNDTTIDITDVSTW